MGKRSNGKAKLRAAVGKFLAEHQKGARRGRIWLPTYEKPTRNDRTASGECR